MSKPFKGSIHNWRRTRRPYWPAAWYVIIGEPRGHPKFSGWIRTSLVQKETIEDAGITVETLNSIYFLVGPEVIHDVPSQGIQKPQGPPNTSGEA